jgi:prophage maintenance system killer protein
MAIKKKIWIPGTREVISYNKKVLDLHQATKGDRHQVLSRSNLKNTLKVVRKFPGDVYDKSAVMMERLARANVHPFASGNRRTAYFTANKMLWKNEGFAMLKKQDNRAEIMNKIRKGELSHDEIKDILRNNK